MQMCGDMCGDCPVQWAWGLTAPCPMMRRRLSAPRQLTQAAECLSHVLMEAAPAVDAGAESGPSPAPLLYGDLLPQLSKILSKAGKCISPDNEIGKRMTFDSIQPFPFLG